jgi:transcriptional regulator with XRE-family HTH domain
MATMKDVARRAGVSESTVSHVLNNTRSVSEAKKAQVLLAMRELGFSANAHARGLALGRSNFLGILISDIENPFFPGVIKSFGIWPGKMDLMSCFSAPTMTPGLQNAPVRSWWKTWRLPWLS